MEKVVDGVTARAGGGGQRLQGSSSGHVAGAGIVRTP